MTNAKAKQASRSGGNDNEVDISLRVAQQPVVGILSSREVGGGGSAERHHLIGTS